MRQALRSALPMIILQRFAAAALAGRPDGILLLAIRAHVARNGGPRGSTASVAEVCRCRRFRRRHDRFRWHGRGKPDRRAPRRRRRLHRRLRVGTAVLRRRGRRRLVQVEALPAAGRPRPARRRRARRSWPTSTAIASNVSRLRQGRVREAVSRRSETFQRRDLRGVQHRGVAIVYAADEPLARAWNRPDYNHPDWWRANPTLPERMGRAPSPPAPSDAAAAGDAAIRVKDAGGGRRPGEGRRPQPAFRRPGAAG